jgi:hypothetical protein
MPSSIDILHCHSAVLSSVIQHCYPALPSSIAIQHCHPAVPSSSIIQQWHSALLKENDYWVLTIIHSMASRIPGTTGACTLNISTAVNNCFSAVS